MLLSSIILATETYTQDPANTASSATLIYRGTLCTQALFDIEFSSDFIEANEDSVKKQTVHTLNQIDINLSF